MIHFRKSPSPSTTFFALALILMACNTHPGYEKLESGIYKKLNAFDDCGPVLSDAEFFIMQVSFKKWDELDTGYTFELHHGFLERANPIFSSAAEPIGLKLRSVLDSMQCGDDVSLILPFEEMNNCYLSAYEDTSHYALKQEMDLRIHLKRTFTRREYLNYLMLEAQKEELPEVEAIQLFLMNDSFGAYEAYGDCFLQRLHNTEGDSIKPGREITIEYTTHLFNGQRLDTNTVMTFQFGKPEQVIGGFQYGLSFMKEGERAFIYLPSSLAFGEDGCSNGIVPPHTPIYFDVKVLDVKAEKEILP